jgi:hypothetical protein
MRGSCFPTVRGYLSGYGAFIYKDFRRPRDCEVLASDFKFTIDRQGRGHGSGTVAALGRCFQHSYGRRITPGLYSVSVGCHACVVAHFRVIRR